MGRNTSEGLAAPNCARYIMMVMGMIVSPEAFMHKNIIMASLAVSFDLLKDCISCIAFSPMGVAALSNPSKLAEKFMNMAPVAGCPAGIPGKSLLNTGAAIFAKRWITPPFSPTFIIPSQSERIPVSPKDISNPVLAESKDALIISVNTATSPPNINLPIATTKATRKKAIQM